MFERIDLVDFSFFDYMYTTYLICLVDING